MCPTHLKALELSHKNVMRRCFPLVAIIKFPEARDKAATTARGKIIDQTLLKALKRSLECHRALPKERQSYLRSNLGLRTHGPAGILGMLGQGLHGDTTQLAERVGAWCDEDVATDSANVVRMRS